MATVKSIAARLELRGIKAIKVDETTIWITQSLYIQVTSQSVVVFNNTPGQMSVYECDNRIDDIVDKLKQALAKGT